MKRVITFIIGLLGCSTFSCISTAQYTEQKPNIIFIVADDFGWKDAGFMGNQYHETPNLDQLARSGMMFTQAYANAPNCAPSRASLLSGLYPPRHGIYTVHPPTRGKSEDRKLIPSENQSVLATTFVTLAEQLQSGGYTTASMGKWHLGNDSETLPTGQGFDVNIGGFQAGHPKSYFSPYQNPYLSDGEEGEHLTDRLTQEAIQFIEAHQKQPFFLYLPFYAVHTPLQAKPELIEKYKSKPNPHERGNATYAAMIETMDTNVGRIMSTLEALNLTENTLIIFFSDNGQLHHVSTAKPLRGSKGMLYEGGIRVPLVVSWKGNIQPQTQEDTPVIGLDLYPTLLSIAGIAPKSSLDGEDLSGLLFQSDTLERKALYWHFPAYLEASRGIEGKWRQTPASAMRYENWKLIESFETGILELYDLEADIGETQNLATTRPQKTQELYARLQKWQTETQALLPKTRNPEYQGQ